MPEGTSARADVQFALRMAALLPSMRELFDYRNTLSRPAWERHVLALLRELVPADRGAVLVEDYVPEPCPAPPEWVTSIRKEGRPLRGVTATGFGLATPLLVGGGVAGVLFLERSWPEYQEEDLLLLNAFAGMAAAALEGAYRQEWLESEVRRFENQLPLEQLLAGESIKIQQLRKRIARVAPTAATVLITGESGTGKELVARALHKGSPRALKPFVAINCAALTESLLESELFGHEKGSFTGATEQKRGRFESGEGGSVFLDEIGEMPVSLQAKLLRVLQNREFERVGGTRTIPLNIRLIAATNRNLEEESRTGRFRQDLYYRLNVITLRTPPLRERPEDIVPLANRFAARFASDCKRVMRGISPEARTLLRNYSWPGNVRELENAIEHAVVLGSSDTMLPEDLPEALRDLQTPVQETESGQLQDAINRAKRNALTAAFESSRGDHTAAAKQLGVHPNYLYRLIRNLGMFELLKGMARD